MKSINKAVAISAQTIRNALKRKSMRFAAALLVALVSFVAIPNAALAASPQHHDQVPGFYRLKVGDLEVTALFDGPGVFDVNWLNGQKTKDDVLKALQDHPHLMDVSDAGYHSHGERADAIRADLGTPDGATLLAKEVRSLVGDRLDVLVSNAGITKSATFKDHTVDDFDNALSSRRTYLEWQLPFRVFVLPIYKNRPGAIFLPFTRCQESI
jgi:hypothetical protein